MAMTGPALRRLVREPLVHFLLIGAGIFALYAWTAGPEVEADRNRITVTPADVERLTEGWRRNWRRDPSPAEVARLVREHVREEVIYREALALGLDRDDPAIRRQLRQKYEFVIQDLAAAPEPGPEDLAAFYQANKERYRLPSRVSFRQVYFSTERGASSADQAARATLATLQARSEKTDPAMLGDRSLLEPVHRDRTTGEISTMLGPEFAKALQEVEVGVWSGPIASAYGLHLVLLESWQDGALPGLAAVDARVRDDWTFQRRREVNEAVFRAILDRYEVVFEDTAAVPLTGGSDGASE